jgi:hypothetical protein
MKRKLLIATGIIIVLLTLSASAAFAYGPASPLGIGGTSLAKQMEDNEWGEDGDAKLSDNTCLRNTPRSYVCMGTMTAEGKEQSVTYDVTVDFNGTWIAH